MRAGSRTTLALALTAAVACASVVSAHRRDELLQAARLAVEPDRVDLELDLTPGIAVADTTIADIDRDRNGVLSADERRAYAARVHDELVLEIDGRPLHIEAFSAVFSGLDEFRQGEGTIRLRSVVALPRQSNGDHHVSFRNRDARDRSVFLANAFAPTNDRIVITAQRRDPAQRDLTIDYVLRPGPATSTSARIGLLGVLIGVAAISFSSRALRRSAA